MTDDFHWTVPLWDAKEFKGFDARFKVPAIMTDGQWYTPDKIRKFSGEDDETVIDIINSMISDGVEIIRNDAGGSYRMSYAALSKWRNDNGIGMDKQLIPTILYPRIIKYGGKHYTEPEVFDMVPLHRFGQVRFTLIHSDDIHDMSSSMYRFGRFSQDNSPEKWRLTCLAGDMGKKLLEDYEESHGGYGSVFDEHGRPNVYNTGTQRDISEFKPGLIEPIIRFYQTFKTTSSSGEPRPAILQPSAYKTLKVYADDGDGENGVISQMNKWIITAIQHYDEKKGIPFAAYLGLIANNRVNDLATNAIGRTLSKFQNRKARAIKNLNKKNPDAGIWYSRGDIIDAIASNDPDYVLTDTEYIDLDTQLKTWQQTRHTTNLQWDESGEEKQTGSFDMENQISQLSDTSRDASLSRIQHAVIHAGVESGKPVDTRLMLEMLRHSSGLGAALLSNLSTELSEQYRESLAQSLQKK
jgi:hypothetical protein